jgi:hypothetical protein
MVLGLSPDYEGGYGGWNSVMAEMCVAVPPPYEGGG